MDLVFKPFMQSVIIKVLLLLLLNLQMGVCLEVMHLFHGINKLVIIQ
jgi:hypothetical protein